MQEQEIQITNTQDRSTYQNGNSNGSAQNTSTSNGLNKQMPVLESAEEAFVDFENCNLVEVQFKGNRRNFYLDEHRLELQVDDYVVVESENGYDYGSVVFVGNCAKARLRGCHKVKNVKLRVVRKSNQEDLARHAQNNLEEPSVVARSRELVLQYKLEMKVTEAEWQFDRQRLTIFFTAPQRVDFRELVKELARSFKTRIELRQISTREETKRIGDGIGCCGLNLCCTSFLMDFSHITLDHARLQQLSNNVTKLSGNCGRLKCCLLFEYDTYSEAFEKYPQLHSRINMPDGMAKLLKVDVFKNISTIFYPDGSRYKTLTYEEISELMKAGKVMPPEREDYNSFLSNGETRVQTKRDMLGEEYIVEI